MLAKVHTYGLTGIEAYLIEIEVDVSRGLPAVTIVGMADTAIRESKERVKAALKNSGFSWPEERITISLAPSSVKKEGSSYDLAIAVGILAASEQIAGAHMDNYHLLGELALDGSLRPVRGILPIAVSAAGKGSVNIIIPEKNSREAGLIADIKAIPLKSLKQTVEFLHEPSLIKPIAVNPHDILTQSCRYAVDFAEVKGQHFAKRAIEIAAAGGHNILMIGPPGSGKSMLAKRIPTIMPEVSLDEALEISAVHSVAGTLSRRDGIVGTRPFRSPHHGISSTAMAGGGAPPQPGEVSLSHLGVLFLDELPEFRRDCLEALRQPLEDGCIRISRISRALTFPASFMLVAAMNPCPCGYYTDPRKACRCNPSKIAQYMGRISGPLMDRIDIHIEVPAIRYRELTDTREAETSSAIKQRVNAARQRQRALFSGDAAHCSAHLSPRLVKKYCAPAPDAAELLKQAMSELGFSARAYDKILKVSRTICDLAGCDVITSAHIAEAIQYRSLDRRL